MSDRRIAELLDRLDWQAEHAGTSPAGLAWEDAARMVREALATRRTHRHQETR